MKWSNVTVKRKKRKVVVVKIKCIKTKGNEICESKSSYNVLQLNNIKKKQATKDYI